MVEIRVKRVHEPVTESDGIRVLADRYWPRGLRRDEATIDLWALDAAPSPELIAWFGHRPERWDEFKARYRVELSQGSGRLMLERLAATRSGGALTLVYGSRDRLHNNAVALAEILQTASTSADAVPIPSAPARAPVSGLNNKAYRDIEALSWLWTIFALAIPVLLLIWGELVLVFGLRAIEVSGLILVFLIGASTIRAVRRDRQMLASQLAGGSLRREDRQHVLVGVGDLLGQLAGVVLGIVILGLLPEGLSLLAHSL